MMKSRKLLFFLIIITSLLINNCRCKAKIKDGDTREPAVAGAFYPADKMKLKKMIDDFLSNVCVKKDNANLRALICPHAGYIYSGPIAASGFSLLKGKSYKKTFIIGPGHYFALKKPSIPEVKYYKTPLGRMKLWDGITRLLKQDCFDSIPEAHSQEHSIEVEIPFLQTVLNDTEIIPILMGQSMEKEVANSLIKEIDKDTLVVVSSDLSHFHSYKEAMSLDRGCVDTILKNDIKKMYYQEACGKYPIIVLMYIAKHFNWEAKLLDLRNSGDTAGAKDKVVGYTAIAFYEKENGFYKKEKKGELTDEDKSILLKLAREAILKKSTNIDINKYKLSKVLKENRGCFVTLQKNKELRGCIGYILPIKPIFQAVIDNAYNAAYSDYRFPAVVGNEIKDLEIEISVLTVPKSLVFSSPDDLLKKLSPLKDGVIIKKGEKSATFLPQVWEQLPEKKLFLRHLCQKAGLSPDAWKEKGFEVQTYQAFVFHE